MWKSSKQVLVMKLVKDVLSLVNILEAWIHRHDYSHALPAWTLSSFGACSLQVAALSTPQSPSEEILSESMLLLSSSLASGSLLGIPATECAQQLLCLGSRHRASVTQSLSHINEYAYRCQVTSKSPSRIYICCSAGYRRRNLLASRSASASRGSNQ